MADAGTVELNNPAMLESRVVTEGEDELFSNDAVDGLLDVERVGDAGTPVRLEEAAALPLSGFVASSVPARRRAPLLSERLLSVRVLVPNL